MGIAIILLAVLLVIILLPPKKKKKPAGRVRDSGKGQKKKPAHKTQAVQSKGGKSSGKKNRNTPSQNSHYQRHFRKFHSSKTTGHPSYVYGEVGNDFKIVQLTQSPKTNGETNIPLDKNPEPGKNKKAYLRPTPTKINKGVSNEKLKGWSFAGSDKPKVQAVIDKEEK